MDTTVCMGASIGAAHGFEKAHPELAGKTVAVIGDSTFLHSGITGLMNVVYNGGTSTVIILDNSITAMTGHQQHPGTGKTLKGEPAPKVDLIALVRALGVERVREVDPYDLTALRTAISEEVGVREPSVIIARRPCALIVPAGEPYEVASDKCTGCKVCMQIGCPAISYDPATKKAAIDKSLCDGCGLCAGLCRFSSIAGKKAGAAND
jgi:indolepyruvate ferredoxin oxidoreductase alpha subunit